MYWQDAGTLAAAARDYGSTKLNTWALCLLCDACSQTRKSMNMSEDTFCGACQQVIHASYGSFIGWTLAFVFNVASAALRLCTSSSKSLRLGSFASWAPSAMVLFHSTMLLGLSRPSARANGRSDVESSHELSAPTLLPCDFLRPRKLRKEVAPARKCALHIESIELVAADCKS